jgi:hypothetical protein
VVHANLQLACSNGSEKSREVYGCIQRFEVPQISGDHGQIVRTSCRGDDDVKRGVLTVSSRFIFHGPSNSTDNDIFSAENVNMPFELLCI